MDDELLYRDEYYNIVNAAIKVWKYFRFGQHEKTYENIAASFFDLFFVSIREPFREFRVCMDFFSAFRKRFRVFRGLTFF